MAERTYQAFVSYRHAERDTQIATEVQHGLERFVIPKALRKDGMRHSREQFVVEVAQQPSDENANSNPTWHCLLVNLGSETIHELKGIENRLTAGLFASDSTLLVCTADLQSLEASILENGQIVIQRPFSREVSCIDTSSGATRWSSSTRISTVTEEDRFLDLGTVPDAFGDAHVVAHCTANVCEMFDLMSGKALELSEFPDSLRLAWVERQEDGTAEPVHPC